MQSNSSPSRVTAAVRRVALAFGSVPSSPMFAWLRRRDEAATEGFPLLVRRPRSFDSRGTTASKDCDDAAAVWREQRLKERYAAAQRSAKRLLRSAPPSSTWGLYAQYFCVGVVYNGLPSTLYGFYLMYLNVPGYVYASASTAIALPWSLKFVLGAINDCVPIGGLRRKPYMIVGWCVCALGLVSLAMTPLPEPYWCVDDDAGRYATTAEPCNPFAPEEAAKFTALMIVSSFGYCVSDVAADGLTVTLARREPLAERGRLQTTIYMVRSMGQICSIVLVGLGMNSPRYGGSFRVGLTYAQICGILAVVATAMIPISTYLVVEPTDDHNIPPKTDDLEATPNLSARVRRAVTIREYAKSVWTLLRSRAMFACILYQFITPSLGMVYTTAAPEVKQHWAGVHVLQNAAFSLIGYVLFAAGLWLVKSTSLIQKSWRLMLLATTVFLNLMDMPFAFLTVFDVVRNQYFFMGEEVVVEIPNAVNFVVSTFVIVEMAEGGNEGIVYGLLTTMGNLGGPVSNAISNQIFGLFEPDLSDNRNYVRDAVSFRSVVAASYVVTYLFSAASLATLPLLPNQKEDAQRRKKDWPRRDAYAITSLVLVAAAFTYGFLMNVLVVFPETACYRFVGGPGCGDATNDDDGGGGGGATVSPPPATG
ncbi:hypothetical protein CTAYLR_004242 [Chrysophaeum taylorii]|uniref:Folate-Biopterin Transporter (FBT) Family n=1 Tax=Chrysophaeum taylorii TaxID=2483200 RepID=A0AAD7XNJ4_9STRA|nr:hypothetical protein CTAYLR_004242 [Chrysophaeum taylorii]